MSAGGGGVVPVQGPPACELANRHTQLRWRAVKISVVFLQKSLGDRTQVVQQTEIDVTGIERTINSVSDLPTTWQSYFSRDG